MKTNFRFFVFSSIFCFGFVLIANSQSKQTNQSKVIMPTKPRTDNNETPVGSTNNSSDCISTDDLPSIPFNNGSAKLSNEAIVLLETVALKLKANPQCKIKISAHGSMNKMDQQLSWDKANSVNRYLVQRTGIAPSRIIFEYGTEGNPDTVDLIFTTEDGPNTQPAPHPDLRRL